MNQLASVVRSHDQSQREHSEVIRVMNISEDSVKVVGQKCKTRRKYHLLSTRVDFLVRGQRPVKPTFT